VLDIGVRLKPGALTALDQLAQRYRLGLVTSSARRLTERMLRHHGLFERFQTITALEDVQHSKPHPEPYLHAMQALQVQPEETIIIEDSLAGAESGAAAGAYVYVIPNPSFKPEQFVNLAQVVFSFDDILKELL
jgi:HAD superfamily hydrolase (TIGR01509 family)